MKHILLSSPHFFSSEQSILESLFEAGLRRFHLRKPDAEKDSVRTWLSQLPVKWHDKIVLHQHWELAEEMELGGIHFPEWYRQKMSKEQWNMWKNRAEARQLSLSTSVHDMETLGALQEIDYVFLSPVFSSISKPGYGPKEELMVKKSYGFECYALGGVQHDNLQEVVRRGFDGAAFLGAIWQQPAKALGAFQQLQQELSRINHRLTA